MKKWNTEINSRKDLGFVLCQGLTPFTDSYDQAGRPASITYPDLTSVTYLYNGPLLAAVYDGTTTYAAYSGYNGLGQPGSISYNNGIVTTGYTYYPNNYRLNTINTTKAGTAYQNMTYVYDNLGNVKSIIDPINANYSYDYDGLNRLTIVNGVTTYAYDQIGNMTSNLQNGGTYLYNSTGNTCTQDGSIKPHAVCNAGGNSYTYDNNGNMRTGAGRTITPDPENRPGTIVANGVTTTFAYDGNGERVKKTTNGVSTIYIGKLYECTNGTCYKYIFANGQRIARKTVGSAETRYYHTDHLGSSSVVTDETGGKVEGIAYYPYGATRDDTGPANMRHKFTGQELDGETGLYFYNARYYDPTLGRFISADTIIPNPADPQALNRYSYVRNNPINLIDPSGHSWLSDATGISIKVGGDVGKALNSAGDWAWDHRTEILTAAAVIAGGYYGLYYLLPEEAPIILASNETAGTVLTLPSAAPVGISISGGAAGALIAGGTAYGVMDATGALGGGGSNGHGGSGSTSPSITVSDYKQPYRPDIIFNEGGNGTYGASVLVMPDANTILGSYQGSSYPRPGGYPTVKAGTYSYTTGMHHPAKPDGYRALIVNNNGPVPTTGPNPNNPTGASTAQYIHIHRGATSRKTGSAGCFTIEPDSWSNFMNNFPVGTHGSVMILR